MTGKPPTVPNVGNSDVARDVNSGRFLPGNTGGNGRPKGARSLLGRALLSALVDSFAEHGKAAIDKLATEQPEAYLRMIGALIPRVGEPVDFSELTDDEFQDEYMRLKTNRQVQTMLDCEGI